MDDTIQADLDEIALTNQISLNKTLQEYNNDNVRNLYQLMLQAEKSEQDAPQESNTAKENYYRARFGDGYQDLQRGRYESQGNKLSTEMLSTHNVQLQKLNDKLQTYSSTITYVNNLEEVTQTWNNKIKSQVQKIQDSTANLNNRTTYYTEESLLSLSRFILFENIFLISYLVVMFLDFNKVNHIDLVIILFILFFSDLFLTLLHKIPNSITSYTQWGYDPMESKTPWIMTVSILVCFALLLTYIQTINELFTKIPHNP